MRTDQLSAVFLMDASHMAMHNKNGAAPPSNELEQIFTSVFFYISYYRFSLYVFIL